MDQSSGGLARAGLERIRRLWRILFGHPWFSLRAPNDEELYQRLRLGLLAQLDNKLEYERARTLAQDVVPEELPTSDDLVGMDSEMYDMFEGGFQRLDAELIRLALAEGIDPNPNDAEAYKECTSASDPYARASATGRLKATPGILQGQMSRGRSGIP